MELNETPTQEFEGASVADFLNILTARKWWVVGSAALCVALALGWSFVLAVPKYEATSRILRQGTSFDQALFNTELFKLRDAERDLQTGSDLIKLEVVAKMVKEELESQRDVISLLRMISVEPRANTDIIEIFARGPDREEAAAVANSFATRFIAYRQEADMATLAAARDRIEQQLARMTDSERSTERALTLAQNAEDLRVLETIQTGGFEVLQLAEPPLEPYSPQPVRNTAVALVGGLLLGVLLALVVDRADRRIRTDDAIENEFGLPILAGIPRLGRNSSVRKGTRPTRPVGFSDPSPAFAESFRTLRSNVKYFEFDRKIKKILVTSGLPQEGKTLTTVNLAISLVLAGARVVVVEADLRRPKIHQYLNISHGVGVSSILTGSLELPRAMQSVAVGPVSVPGAVEVAKEGDGTGGERILVCVTSGPPPPNPGELVGSQKMKDLIDDVSSLADYVLIDTPPLLVVSDALSLMGLVDAVIVCARAHRTTLEEARRVRTILHRTGAHTLGVVVSGSRQAGIRSYDRTGYFIRPEDLPHYFE